MEIYPLKQTYQERVWALSLTLLLFGGLWLGAGWVQLTRHSPKVRSLLVEDGFEIMSATSTVKHHDRNLPEPPALKRVTISLPKIESKADLSPIGQRLPSSRQVQLEIDSATVVSSSSSVRLRSMHSLVAREATNRIGVVLKPVDREEIREKHVRVSQQSGKPGMVAQRPSGQTRPVESEEAVLPERESVDIEEFLRWMRLAEGELPPGIKRHIGYRPGNLTALASLEHNGASPSFYSPAILAFVLLPDKETGPVWLVGAWNINETELAGPGGQVRGVENKNGPFQLE